jgi:putative sigma-54 modulation protein
MRTMESATSVHIRIHEPELLDEVRAYVDRTLQTSFQRFAGRVRNVRITLQDVNGPRGGMDKSCRIQAQLFPSRRWVMHEVRDANIFAAITAALQRVKYTVRKAFERRSAWRERRETIRKASAPAEEEDEAKL